LKIKWVLLIAILLSFSSCATLVNNTNTRVNIYTDVDSSFVRVADSTDWYQTPVSFSLPRSSRSVLLEIRTDTITQNVILPAKLSREFVYGNFWSFRALGWTTDLFSDKKYTYQKDNYIKLTEPNKYSLTQTVAQELRYSLFSPTYRNKSLLFPNFLVPKTRGTVQQKINIGLLNVTNTRIGDANTTGIGILNASVGANVFLSNIMYVNTDMGMCGNSKSEFLTSSPNQYSQNVLFYWDFQIGLESRRFHTEVGPVYFHNTYFEENRQVKVSGNVFYKNYSFETNNIGLGFASSYTFNEVLSAEMSYMRGVISENRFKVDLHRSTIFTISLLYITNYRPIKSRAGYRKPYVF